ncbi:MAG: hypothetical protein IRZ16_21015 [Myxococcaceae bacterium]|nr:hypothetical protein [Myxococcaceae bacterium]
MTVRQLVCLFASLVVLSHCATADPAHTGDWGGGAPERVQDERGNQRIPDSRQPTSEELAAAFEPEGPPPAPATDAAAPAVASGVSDPLAEAKQAFEEAAQRVEKAIAARDPDALAQAASLNALAEPLGPAQVTRAWTLRAKAARTSGDDAGAVAFAQRWLLSCGPTAPDACRRQALRWMEESARHGAHAAKTKRLVADVRKADACLVSAETSARRGGAVPACLSAAERMYRTQRDGLMQARAALVRAQAAQRDERHAERGVRELSRAEQLCTEARCAQVRRAALARLVDAELERGDRLAAARAAIREGQVYAATLPPAERLYAWTDTMDRACAALDAARGTGSCRALERHETGAFVFRDFSRQFAGEGLGPEVVRAVNAHFGVTFEECLASEAERLRMPAQERYTVRWTVLNDGHVGQMRMDRQERDDGPLARCLRQKLTLWRYPRYEGEWQHVEQSFVVTARTHMR